MDKVFISDLATVLGSKVEGLKDTITRRYYADVVVDAHRSHSAPSKMVVLLKNHGEILVDVNLRDGFGRLIPLAVNYTRF